MKLVYDTENLRQFCRERGIARLDIFGSALREDFRPDSDVDLLCTLVPDSDCTLLGWADIRFGLQEIFGRPVDLVSRTAILRSRNKYRRDSILATATPLYVA